MKMGKSEINPFGMVTESSGTSSSSSDSEPEYATEMLPPPACDRKSCTSGEDEPMACRDEAEPRGRRGQFGPWRGRMHPMMFMMMMGGPRRGGHGHPPPMGPAPPPFMAMGRSVTPDCRGSPGRRRQIKGERPRCHSAPGGRRGGPWAPAGPCCGPRPGGPCMRRRFMRQMLRNPEFWQRMHEKFAETEDKDPLAKDVSDNETKKEKKCHGRRGERREMWQRFMQHMFEEMNLHASTESSEGDEGNHTDKCSEEENSTKNKTAADKKKVHFGSDEYFDEENLRPSGFLWMFPGRLGMRFRHGGPWDRSGCSAEMNMHDDPRMMMHGDPRMGHGDPRMMFGCRPRRWMFRHMMRNAASSEDEKSASDCEEKMKKRCQMREKRQNFRRAVQEMGVHPWMFRMLAYQMYGQKTGSGDKEAQEEEIPGKKTEKKERFLQILKDLGTYPWMFRVLANQRARAAAITGSESEGEAPLEGAAVADKGRPDRCRRRQRRQMFREMAKQMGWTSDSDGEALTDGEKEGKTEGKQEEKERRKERRRMREMMRGMGWMPWMLMGRRQHHHHGHRPEDVEDSDAEHDATNSNKKPKVMQKEKREQVKQFRQAVNEIGVRPWMFRLLAHEIYGKKNEAATSEEESANAERNAKKGLKKEKFLQILREIGAYPWMFRVLANQRACAAATTGSEPEGEAPLEGAASDEGSSDKCRRRQRRQMFREMAKQMGWTSDSDGEALTDGEKEEKEKRKEERRMRKMMRGMGWMPWMMMGRHHHHDGHHQSEAEKSDAEQGDTKCEIKREKVKQFRQAVQETGVRPWMFRLLAREMYGKTHDTSEDESAKEQKKGKKSAKKEKYLQILREIGTYPWMFRVLANQRARAAATTGSESEGEAPLEGAAAADKGSPDRCRRMQRRQMFREMAKQMGWTSDSDGEALTDGEKEGETQGKQDEKERRKEERRRMKEMMRGMGWMPWMMMGRHHHHRDHDEDHHLTQ